VFVDPNTLQPHFALLDYEKFMNFNVKDLLVPWSELQLGDGEVQTRPAEGHHTNTSAAARPIGVDASSAMSVDPELYDEDENFAIPGRTGGFD
jgi:hypothetical protein